MQKPLNTQAAKQKARIDAVATATLHQEALMDAMIASCALVAHADGAVDPIERKRLFRLMRALPTFDVFSPTEVAAEFDDWERRFTEDPVKARERAVTLVTSMAPRSSDVKMLLFACQQVLEADGVADPKEYEALGQVGRALETD